MHRRRRIEKTDENEFRKVTKRIVAFNWRKRLDPKMTAVARKPDPKRQFVSCWYPIHSCQSESESLLVVDLYFVPALLLLLSFASTLVYALADTLTLPVGLEQQVGKGNVIISSPVIGAT